MLQLASSLLSGDLFPPGVTDWAPQPRVDDERLEQLRDHLRTQGIIPVSFEAPVEAAVRGILRERPLLALDADDRPLIVSERLGRRVRVEAPETEPEWIDVLALADRLALDPSEEHTWLAPELAPQLKDDAPSPWATAYALIRPEGRDIWATTIYAMGVGILSLALPVAAQVLVNTVAFGTLIQPIVVLSALVGLGLSFAATLRALQAWVVEVIQRRFFVRTVSALAERLPRVHVEAFEAGQGPELINRFFDVFTTQKALAGLLVGGIEAVLTIGVGLLVLAFYHPALLGLGIVIFIGAAVVVFVFGRGGAETAVKESKAKYAVAWWLEEMARHTHSLKNPGGDKFAVARLDTLATHWLQTRTKHFRVVFRQLLGALSLQVATSVALLAIGGWLVVERQLTLGQLVAAELIVTAVVAALSKLGPKLESAYDLAAATDKLGVLLRLPIERVGGEEMSGTSRGASVVFDRVTTEDGVLVDFNLRIDAGDKVLFRGSAIQRQAVAELLFGAREPKSGVITVDGQDLGQVRLSALRKRVAVVRDAEIFAGTVAENIRIGGPTVPSDRVWEILETVGVATEIRRLPRGLQTELTVSHAALSREGALRLTIARALASDPAVLVLEGIAHSLDYEWNKTGCPGFLHMTLLELEPGPSNPSGVTQ